MEKMLTINEVALFLKVSRDTAKNKMLEIREYQKQKNKKVKFIRGRISEKALREYYDL